MNQQLMQVFKQLQAIWKQLGLNQKITLVGTTLAVLAGFGGLITWSSRPSYSLLYGKLDEAEASKVVSYLDEAKIPYKINHGNGSITVPSDKVYPARMQLASRGVPRGGDAVGFEIFDRSNFGISDFVQQKNYLRALQGELSRTVSEVDSVESARVMIVLPENRLVATDKNRPTASVFVKVRGMTSLPQQSVNAIRFLVANAVEGLQPDKVSVVDNLGHVLSDTMEPDSAVGLTQTQLEVRKKTEQYLAKKAEGMLEQVLGPGNAVVRVSAEMSFDTTTREEVKYDPDSLVALNTTENEETTDSLNATPVSSAPGVDSNTVGDTNTVAAVPQTKNQTRKKVKTNQYEVNKTTSNVVQAAGTVKHLTAAVFLASRMQGTGTNRVAVPRTQTELDGLLKTVQLALGIPDADKQSVTLQEYPFNDQGAEELAQNFKKDQKWQFGFQVFQTLLYPVAGLMLMGMLWRLFKRTPDMDIPIGIPVGEGEESAAGNVTANGKSGRRSVPGTVTVDVLNQLIRENPQNMTHAIRGWMTRGQTK